MTVEKEKNNKLITTNLFKNKDFDLLFMGGLVSRVGSAIHLVALTWFILELTGSGSATGIILLLSTLPGVIISPFSGTLADRVNRKFLIVGMDYLRGFVAIWLSWTVMTGRVDFIHLGFATVLLSLGKAFFNPALSATLPNIVSDDNLQQANSIEHFSQNFAKVIGAAIGGVLIGIFGPGIVFFINGISFLISATSEIFITVPPISTDEKQDKQDLTLLNDIKFGIKYLYQHKNIFYLFSVVIVLNFLGSGLLMVALPYTFKEVLSVNSKLYGISQSIFPAGAFICSIFLSFLSEIKDYYKTFIINISLQTIFFISFGLPISPFFLGQYPIFKVYCILVIILFILGITNAVINIPLKVLLQRLIPDKLRGRIFGLLITFAQGLVPISMALTGFVIDFVPAYLIFIIAGALHLPLIYIISRISVLKNLNNKMGNNKTKEKRIIQSS
jgi:MFS family permease